MTTTLEEIEELAAKARPINDADWGTERQIEAENAFFDACMEIDAATFDPDGGSNFVRWCLKATSEGMIDEAMKLVRPHFENASAPKGP